MVVFNFRLFVKCGSFNRRIPGLNERCLVELSLQFHYFVRFSSGAEFFNNLNQQACPQDLCLIGVIDWGSIWGGGRCCGWDGGLVGVIVLDDIYIFVKTQEDKIHSKEPRNNNKILKTVEQGFS